MIQLIDTKPKEYKKQTSKSLSHTHHFEGGFVIQRANNTNPQSKSLRVPIIIGTTQQIPLHILRLKTRK
jgi:hypothetical protein